MYAIIEAGGKQYKVEKGDIIFIEKLSTDKGANVDFKVVALANEGNLTLGSPYVDFAKVSAKILKNGKGKKITVFTYKPKNGKNRKLGHRQPYSKVQIEEINA